MLREHSGRTAADACSFPLTCLFRGASSSSSRTDRRGNGCGESQPGAVIKVVPATCDSGAYSPTATFARSERCWLSQVRSARHRPRLADTSAESAVSCLAAGTVTRSDRPSADAGMFSSAANLRRRSKVTGLLPFSIWLRCCWVIPTATATSTCVQPIASRYSRIVGPASSPVWISPPCLGRSHCSVIRHHQLCSTRSVSHCGDTHRQRQAASRPASVQTRPSRPLSVQAVQALQAGRPGHPCEKFLYGFKAARRAARAAATARTPALPLALPLRRRQRRSAGAKAQRCRAAIDVQAITWIRPQGRCPCSRCRIVRGRAEPVKSACGVGSADLRLLTEPARPGRWQRSEARTGVARTLTLKRQRSRDAITMIPASTMSPVTKNLIGIPDLPSAWRSLMPPTVTVSIPETLHDSVFSLYPSRDGM
jgi:hypothetical protein